MRQLEGRVAIVTGAGRGIGPAVALRFATEGARVVVNGRTAATIAATVQLITRQGGEAVAVAGDVAQAGVAERIARTAADRWGRIDILVNNAAVIGPVEILGAEDVDQWMDTLRINVLGPFLLTRAVVPMMKAARRGKVIDVNSAANRGGGGNLLPYRVSKAALLRRTTTLAEQLAEFGIEVNAFDARATTDMVREMATRDDRDPALAARFRQRLQDGEPTPEQNAEVCLWLASDRSAGLTGRNIAWWMELSDLDRLKDQIIADPRALRMDMVEMPGVSRSPAAEAYENRKAAPRP